MWFTPEVRRILAYSKPGDLRKSIDGLVGLGKSVLEEDPLSGSLSRFNFCPRAVALELRWLAHSHTRPLTRAAET